MSQKLTKCKSCEKEISVDAKTCPHCGAPNKKKMGCISIIGIVFGIMFLGLIIIAQFGENGNDETDSSNYTNSNKSQTIFAMNQPVRVGNIEWVITEVRRGSYFSSEYAAVRTESNETILVWVSGKVTNRSNQIDSTFDGNLYLVDANGTKYGEKTEGALVAEPLALDTFNPNVPKRFSTIFEIPSTLRNVKFQATNFAVFGEKTAFVDLALD